MVLTDMVMPRMSGLEFLEQVKRLLPRAEVALMTGHGSIETAVQAMKLGAYDYISKPFELDDLRLVVKNAAETIQLRRENVSLRRRIEVERSQRGALLGNSEGMQRVRSMIEKVAETDATVLVLDRRLHIRRFTPLAGKLLTLIESDVGRPFRDIASTLSLRDRVPRLSHSALICQYQEPTRFRADDCRSNRNYKWSC